MWAEFKHTLRRMRGQIIGWGLGLALYGLMMALLYDSVSQMDNLQQLLESYPKEIMGFFGDLMAITTPQGYLDIYYFGYLTVIIGIFAVSAAAGLLAGDEERGTLDLILAHPISRSGLFWGRTAGYVVATVIILGAGWLSWVIPSGSTGMDLSPVEFLRPFGPLLAQLLLFGGLALLLSMLMPSSRAAGMVAGGLLVANYLVAGLAHANADLQAIVDWTPLHFYQGGYAVEGLKWGWLAGVLAVAAALALLAWWRFQQRDIRVGGEGGWRLPSLRRRSGADVGQMA